MPNLGHAICHPYRAHGPNRHGAQIHLYSPNACYAGHLAPIAKGLQVSSLGWHLRRGLAHTDTHSSPNETATGSHPNSVEGPAELNIATSSTSITLELRCTRRRLAKIGPQSSLNPVPALSREMQFRLSKQIARKLSMSLEPEIS